MKDERTEIKYKVYSVATWIALAIAVIADFRGQTNATQIMCGVVFILGTLALGEGAQKSSKRKKQND